MCKNERDTKLIMRLDVKNDPANCDYFSKHAQYVRASIKILNDITCYPSSLFNIFTNFKINVTNREKIETNKRDIFSK